MSGQDEDLGNLHMLRRIGSIDSHIGDVVASEGLDALIDIGSTVAVAMETDVTEVGLNQAWLQVGDTNGRVGHIDTQSIGQSLEGASW